MSGAATSDTPKLPFFCPTGLGGFVTLNLDRNELCFLVNMCSQHITNSSPKLAAIVHKLIEALASESTGTAPESIAREPAPISWVSLSDTPDKSGKGQ